MKKIGILGSGEVGKTLTKGFLKHGYEVMIGSRDSTKLIDWQKQNGGKTGSFAETTPSSYMCEIRSGDTSPTSINERTSPVKINPKIKSNVAIATFCLRSSQQDRSARPATILVLTTRNSRECEVSSLPSRMPIEIAAARISSGLCATRGCARTDMFSDAQTVQ